MASSFAPSSIAKITRSSISSPLSSGASKISGITPKLSVSGMRFRPRTMSSPILSSQSSVTDTLVETNKILVEIQQQIGIAFGMRNAEEREKNENLKEERSRRRLRLREGALESVKKIGGAIKKTAKFVASPFKGFFDKILEFISLLGLGIGANAIFKWFEKKENREKLKKFFKIIVSNWKLIRNILGVLGGAIIVSKLLGFIGAIKSLSLFLLNPATLTVLATLAAVAAGTYALSKAAKAGISEVQKRTYGEGNAEKGAFITALGDNFGRISTKQDRAKLTPQEQSDAVQIDDFDRLLKKRQTINDELFRAKESAKYEGMDPYSKNDPAKIAGLTQDLADIDKNISDAENQTKIGDKTIKELFENYKLTGTLPLSSIQKRYLGGPVNTGNTYLVGERGPEIFTPNIDGSIVNNMRTEKIYQMISSKNAGKINFVSMELPPKFMNSEKNAPTEGQQEIPIPTISAVNGSNPYMSITPNVYGIYV